MRLAKSIKYGGLLVHSEDCDYQSYQKLGLICPNCNNPVHLVAETNRKKHTRKLKSGKIVNVNSSAVHSFFSHFGGIGEDCDLKASFISKEELKKQETASRNQRLKVFQRKFWEMVSSCYKLRDWEDVFQEITSIVESSKSAKTTVKNLINDFKQRKEALKLSMPKFIEDLYEKSLSESFDPVVQKALEKWRGDLDLKLQAKICQEALDYLCARSSNPLLEKMVVFGINNFVGRILIEKYGSMEEINKISRNELIQQLESVYLCTFVPTEDQYKLLEKMVAEDILCTLGLTNWREGFS